MAENTKGGDPGRKQPAIDQANRPTAMDFDAEISKLTVRDLSSLVSAHVESLKAEKEISKTEKEVFKGEKEKEHFKPEKEKEALKGEKEKEHFKPEKEKERLKPEKEKEFFKPEKEKEAFKPEKEAFKPEKEFGKPEDKPIDQFVDRVAQVAVERTIAELRKQNLLR